MRILLRLAALLLVAIQLTACYSLEDTAVKYAPGYGYLVHVQNPRGGETEFYVFPTQQQAQDFVANFPARGMPPSKMPPPGVTVISGDGPVGKQFRKTWNSLSPQPDTGGVNTAIDRATPPLPTGPQPQ